MWKSSSPQSKNLATVQSFAVVASSALFTNAIAEWSWTDLLTTSFYLPGPFK